MSHINPHNQFSRKELWQLLTLHKNAILNLEDEKKLLENDLQSTEKALSYANNRLSYYELNGVSWLNLFRILYEFAKAKLPFGN